MRDPTVTPPAIRVEKFTNLSTGHVSDDVRKILDKEDHQPWVDYLAYMSGPYGWFVHLPETEDNQQLAPTEEVDPQSYWAIPECLRTCFDHVRPTGSSWIYFDSDEEATEGLPYYDW